MNKQPSAVITGTGCYIPPEKVPNSAFLEHTFLDANGNPYDRSNEEIIEKFEAITGIRERRYAPDNLLASDMAALAAEKALSDADLDKETLDYIIVAHNFGDLQADNPKVDMVPSLASRVKQKLAIDNPQCIAYDLPFGCPGWLQGLIQANYYIRSGDARQVLVIGSETLSRVCDPHDRDSMIYADGAGATVLGADDGEQPVGILSHAARTDTNPEADYLTMGRSFNDRGDGDLFLKMQGRKLYQYALKRVPGVVKRSLEQAGLSIKDVAKVLIHQANAKMDEAILQRLLKLYNISEVPPTLMPMTISWLGNTSVATIPTLLDLIRRNKLDNHQVSRGDILVFASVGAGMNVNALVYREK
ncbi:3-oxoacyl-[acyl-carrier-protein] synthase-3 [Fodinibius roseus]|uniref:3-oxoacyl-[acyl-carrier-protein] synthase-3 n=1 Tax=Fodinibius roseus TaxID=1194090 RepID=A0A1M5HXI9_9BACT|nr:ketoacyl-ACP synthase III [Fodinibius roseus]SHG20706.1 3-oxoacyl-[acyl-carrier-protein] synthase-3 [Fodinibius roseus]